jgi:hypothetical protein
MTILLGTLLGLLALGAFWLVCGVVTYKATFAYFQQKWPTLAEEEREHDKAHARFMAAGGPIGLLVHALNSGFQYGFSVPAPEVDADYEAAHDAWMDEERAKDAEVDATYEASLAAYEDEQRAYDE